MVSIHVDGEDKTAQISDWTITWSKKHETLQLTCHFPSKKTYTRPLSDCRVAPTRELGQMLLMKQRSAIVRPIEKATIYGERYALVYYPGSTKPYLHKLEGISFVAQTAMKETPVFHYFTEVANIRQNRASSSDQQSIAANVVRQLEKLPPSSDTALHAYCTGQNGGQTSGEGLIYPFGVNESQLAAVEQAFSAQISVIEGPPGTGKTQTILNILANILLRGKTVAVLSNNNAAVENVYEKLEKFSLDHLVAKLGSQENRESFFANLPPWPTVEAETAPSMAEIQAVLARLKQHLRDHNLAAQLQAEIDELNIERRYLQQWREDNEVPVSAALDKYGLSPRKTADLMAYLSHLGERRVRLRDRFELLFNFKIFRTKPFAQGDGRLLFFHALQMHYYDKTLREKEAALRTCRESLARGHFTALLQTLTVNSMRYLKRHLHTQERVSDTFDSQTYRLQFDDFLRRFPIIGSS
ncbi:AAA domain-containing protein, partial [Chromobacterium vaccinii]|uniref:AAA domain-containing protein n=1 Tax=Chromobacterium vaccinii TaxID=1108595 RepID=UPI003C787E79